MRRPPATFSTDALSWSRVRVRPPPESTTSGPGLSSSSGSVPSRKLRRTSSMSLTEPNNATRDSGPGDGLQVLFRELQGHGREPSVDLGGRAGADDRSRHARL